MRELVCSSHLHLKKIADTLQIHNHDWHRSFDSVFSACTTFGGIGSLSFYVERRHRIHVFASGLGIIVLAAICIEVRKTLDLPDLRSWGYRYQYMEASPHNLLNERRTNKDPVLTSKVMANGPQDASSRGSSLHPSRLCPRSTSQMSTSRISVAHIWAFTHCRLQARTTLRR